MYFIIKFSNGIVQLSSIYNICAIKSMIVLEMKCPQLSKPEATAARIQNSIGDRMEKKTLGETVPGLLPASVPFAVLGPTTVLGLVTVLGHITVAGLMTGPSTFQLAGSVYI